MREQLVSCIMPTKDRRDFIPIAVDSFLRQSYPEKELIIIDDGSDVISDLLPLHQNVRHIRLERPTSLGRKRNLGCELAKGNVIVHWDDDDWYPSWRIAYQVEQLATHDVDLCGISNVFFVDCSKLDAWEYIHPDAAGIWLSGASMCYQKAIWDTHRFADVMHGEDTLFAQHRDVRKIILANNRFLIARIHRGNTCPKNTHALTFQVRSMDEIKRIGGPGFEHFLRCRTRLVRSRNQRSSRSDVKS